MKLPPIDPDVLRQARAAAKKGDNLRALARDSGVSYYRLRSAVDPAYHERHLKKCKQRDRRVRKTAGNLLAEAEIVALVPADTRTLTGRLVGDPLPGRSALDQLRRNCPLWRPTNHDNREGI